MKPLRYIAKSDGPQSGYWKVIDTKTAQVKQVTLSRNAADGIAASLNKGTTESCVMKKSQLTAIIKEELAKMLHEEKTLRFIATSDGMQRGYYKVVDTQTGKTVLTTGSHVAAGREAASLNQSGPRGISGSTKTETVDTRGWSEEEKETYRDNLRSRRAARDRENIVRAKNGHPLLKTHNPNPRGRLPGEDIQKEVKAQPITLRCPKCDSSNVLNLPKSDAYACMACGNKWKKEQQSRGELDNALPNDYRKFVPEAVRDDDTRSFDDVVFAYLDKQKASGVTDGMTLAKSIRVKFGFQLKQAKLMVIDWSKRKSAIKEASANGKLSPELKEKFLNIASALSPENISWDGERPKSAIARERSRLNAEWKKLEAQVGRKVSEDEVWTENTIIKEEAIPSSETFKNATTAKAFIAKYAIRGCTGFYGVTDRQGYNARFFQFDPKKTDKNSAVRDVIKFVRVREGDEMLKYSSVEIVEKSPKRIVIKWILPDSSG